MATSRTRLLLAILGLLCLTTTDAQLSKEAEELLTNIRIALNKKLSSDCKTKTASLTTLAKTDSIIYGMCEMLKGGVAKEILGNSCTQEDNDAMIETICQIINATESTTITPFTVNSTSNVNDDSFEPNSALSKNAADILVKIYNGLKGNLTETCTTAAMKATSMAKSDDIVYKLCSLLNLSLVTGQIKKSCSNTDFTTIKTTICLVIDENPRRLSEKYQIALNNIEKKLNNSLSDKCSISIKQIQSVAKTDEALSKMCNQMNNTQTKDHFLSVCNVSEYDKIKTTVCNEIDRIQHLDADDGTTDFPSLSKKVEDMMHTIQRDLNQVLSDTCKNAAKMAYSFATSDQVVYELCKKLDSELVKGLIMNSCSNTEYVEIKSEVCKVIPQGSNTTVLSEKFSTALSNINKTLYGALSSNCNYDIGEFTAPATNDAYVLKLCDTVANALARKVLTVRCTDSEYKQINTTICKEIAKLKGVNAGSGGLSKGATNVLNDLKKKLGELSAKCKTVVMSATAFATSDEFVFNLCNFIKTASAKALISPPKCTDSDYTKIKSFTCTIIKEYNKKYGGNATAQLSKKASTLLKTLKDSIKSNGGNCKINATEVINEIKTDSDLNSVCEDMKTRCSTSNSNAFQKSVCEKASSYMAEITNAQLAISKQIYKFPKVCTMKVNLPSRGTWYELNKLCDEVKSNDKDYYQQNCTPEHYSTMQSAVCASNCLTFSVFSLSACVVITLLKRYDNNMSL